MYIDDFDLISFFDDKYKTIKAKDNVTHNDGIGATGIITQKQCIFRINEPAKDSNNNLIVGLGTHYEEEDKIYKEI